MPCHDVDVLKHVYDVACTLVGITLSREQDVFAVLQIGLGKSLIYHILALLTAKSTVVQNSYYADCLILRE